MKNNFLSLFVLSWTLVPLATEAQTLSYEIEMQATASKGRTPLWLSANRYGLSGVRTDNAYLETSAKWDHSQAIKHFGWNAELDMAATIGMQRNVAVQQAYIEGRWRKGTLTIGAKEHPMQLKNNSLSSGSQALGINAAPVPQIRLALPEYTKILNWLAIKGHIAYGKFTDGQWQESYCKGQKNYTTGAFYHSKAGYLLIGRERKGLSAEIGLEMAAQFGGTHYNKEGAILRKNKKNWKSFWNILWGGGGDVGEIDFPNAEGNQLGTWLMRLNYHTPSWGASVYADHYFNDHSMMFFLDYDGYGKGEEWKQRKSNTYLVYPLKDIMLGIEVELKRSKAVRHIVLEYLYTKYQSGPIYHDRSPEVSDHIGGLDDYTNHGMFGAWQHWGMVMNNPLYRSPLYNDEHLIRVLNNRFVAWHWGMDGTIGRVKEYPLNYRLLCSVQKSWGTYEEPYVPPRHAVNLMLEMNCMLASGWQVSSAVGMDRGGVFGKNTGLQITLTKKGIL